MTTDKTGGKFDNDDSRSEAISKSRSSEFQNNRDKVVVQEE